MNKFIFGASLLIAMCLISVSTNSQVSTYSLTNSSGMVITSVSLSPNNANLWGMGVNTTGNIAVDRSVEFTHTVDKVNCIYDVRYTGEDGKYYYVQDVDLCTSTTIILPNPMTTIDIDKTKDADKKPDDSKPVNDIKPVNDDKPVDDSKPTDIKPTDDKPAE